MDDDIHRLIYSNLMQLSLLHPVSFPIKEEMFKGLNIKGFQNTMHYLLTVIDPVRCAQMKWPVLDKKDEAQFRVTVKLMLAETNEKYPEADFPVIFPSMLMKPSGEKFVHLMWCVSKFALFKKLCETYGQSDMLFPLKTLKNDPLFNAKLGLIQMQIDSTTQKALANQAKLDALNSLEQEREMEAQLKELEDEARSYEKMLKETVQSSPIAEDAKKKLCNLDHDIADLIAEQDAECRTVEAMIHVLNKNSIQLSECCETVKLLESSEGSESCIDAKHFRQLCDASNVMDADVEELMIKVKDGKISLSSFLEALNRLLPDVTRAVSAERLPDVNAVLPSLQNWRSEFQDCESSMISTEAKLGDKLKELRSSTAEMHAERRAQKGACKEESSSSAFLSFLSSVVGKDEGFGNPSDVMDEFMTPATPARGVVDTIVSKHKESAAPQFDPDLLLTPEMSRDNSSPFTTPDSRSVRTVPFSTARSQAANPQSLFSSLVKKQHHSLTLQQRFNSGSKTVQRQSRGLAAVSKELFEHSPADTDEVHEPGSSVSKSAPHKQSKRVRAEGGAPGSSVSKSAHKWRMRDIAEGGEPGPSVSKSAPHKHSKRVTAEGGEQRSSVSKSARLLWSLGDIAEGAGLPVSENANQQDGHNGENDGKDLLSLSLSEHDVSSSPSAMLMCTETPTETAEPKCRQEQRRKSLEALIQRYRKVRQNMSNK
ncbi:uncharacterized protein dgt6 isoform X2 [Periplaneta americana]|uniref:uncharacterized protein dgt6 isoform X2 n=1 Tax=Periplaneta americana TaxID=6978 RepID=UPI0037E89C08